MLLVDMSMVLHRCFHKMDFLANSKGVHTGMEYGSFRILESLQKKFPNQEIILVFDIGKSDKQKQYPQYKGNRTEGSSEFYRRINVFRDMLQICYKTSFKQGIEADEIIYTLAYVYPSPHYIYTNDDDLLQAISDELHIKVIKSFESKLYYWDAEKVKEKYFVSPNMLPMFRAFVGDSSDNLPGIPRVNKKLMAEALYNALEKWDCKDLMDYLKIVYEENLFGDKMKEQIRLWITEGSFFDNYNLMKLKSIDCEIFMPTNENEKLKEFLVELEIYSLNICKKLGMNAVQENEEF